MPIREIGAFPSEIGRKAPMPYFFFFFFTLVIGPGRSLSFTLSDIRDYGHKIRARLNSLLAGTVADDIEPLWIFGDIHVVLAFV